MEEKIPEIVSPVKSTKEWALKVGVAGLRSGFEPEPVKKWVAIVMDASGWDRSRTIESLNEKITFDEFMNRLANSTVMYRPGAFNILSAESMGQGRMEN